MLAHLETDRLFIEPLAEAHFDFLVEMGSLMEVMQFLNGRPLKPEETIAELKAHLNGSCLAPNLGLGVMKLKSTGELIGKCNLNHVRDFEPMVHLGYRLHPKFWKKGYALECAETLMKHGFEQLQLTSIYGLTHPSNWASQRILLKLGMHFQDKKPAYNTVCKFFCKQR